MKPPSTFNSQKDIAVVSLGEVLRRWLETAAENRTFLLGLDIGGGQFAEEKRALIFLMLEPVTGEGGSAGSGAAGAGGNGGGGGVCCLLLAAKPGYVR